MNSEEVSIWRRGGALPRPRRLHHQNCTTGGDLASRFVGADDPVRPAVCTREPGRTNAKPYHVCRGRCPHRPARRTSVLRCIAANLQMPRGRTEASAPTGRFTFSPKMRAILQLHFAGSMWASTPTDVLRYRRLLCGFVGAPRAGGVEPCPYADLRDSTRSPKCVRICKCLLRNPSVSFADSIPTLFVPSGHFPLIGGIDPLHKGALVRAMHQHHAPREIPRRGRSPFLVGQRFAKGRSKLPLAVFLYTASPAFFPHGKKAGLSLRRCTVPCNTHSISQCFT